MTASGAFGLFGKLPFRDDFVRLCAVGEPFGSFDEWLVSAIEWAIARAGDGWSKAFAAGAVYAFAFRGARTGSRDPMLIGAIAPSADRAGRQFPLSVGVPLIPSSELLSSPEALPIVMEETWLAATEFVAVDRSILAVDLEQRLAALSARPAPPSEALGTYHQWLEDLPVAEFWTLLYGRDYGEQPLHAIRLIAETIRPHRGVERSATPLTLRLPLGQAGGAAVCFWLDLTRRLLQWKETIPSFFWSHDGATGQLLLHLGTPPHSSCLELWHPRRTSDEVCDLTVPIEATDVAAFTPLPAGLASSIVSDRLRLSELMEHSKLR